MNYSGQGRRVPVPAAVPGMKLSTHKCPRCGRDAESGNSPFRPFCSERCKLIDLGRWVSGTYRIPTGETPDEKSMLPKPDKESGES